MSVFLLGHGGDIRKSVVKIRKQAADFSELFLSEHFIIALHVCVSYDLFFRPYIVVFKWDPDADVQGYLHHNCIEAKSGGEEEKK